MITYNKKDIPEHLQKYFETAELGLENNFQTYISHLCDIFDEVKRVLKKEGTCWVNIGDTYMGNSSYSAKGRQGFGNDKVEMMNKTTGVKLVKATDIEKYGVKKFGDRLKCFGSGELKDKCLCQIPSRFAIEMTNRGWILRNEIIWHKLNCMPASVKDRFTVDFEKLFFFVRSKKYWFEQQKEPTKTKDTLVRNRDVGKLNNTPGRSKMSGLKTNNYDSRNCRCVWTINTKPFKEAHFAVYPETLCETPIKAGCPKGGIVLDPFFGAGTTGLVAKKQGKNYIGIEISQKYCDIAEKRIKAISNKLF